MTTIRVEQKNKNNKSRIDFIHNEIILVLDEHVIQRCDQKELEQHMSRQMLVLLEEEHNPISSLVQQTKLGKELAFKKGMSILPSTSIWLIDTLKLNFLDSLFS